MADRSKYRYPPAPPSGSGTFSDNLVGFQVVDGGGFTQGNFEFTTSVVEKVNRTFDIGGFSKPISLDDIDISSTIQSREILAKNYQVYPNYDISQVTNFTLYGSLQKRLAVSISRIISYYPAAIEVNSLQPDFTTANTATNISYDNVDNSTTFDIDVTKMTNPFDVDYSENSDRNLQVRATPIAPIRNLTREYLKYALYVNNMETEYKFVDFEASTRLSAGTITITVEGNPFSGASITRDTLILRPTKLETEKEFKNNFDEVEDFLLNRMVKPRYTAKFNVIRESDDGTLYKTKDSVTFPIFGVWNLDILSNKFDDYIEKVNRIAADIDRYKTDLIVRFLTTGSLKDFDTGDQKVEKVLQIYGRSFDETKKFIDALSFMNSVHYIVKDDIPSELLKNLAQTLGWNSDVTLLSNEDFLNNVFGVKNDSIYSGQARDMTPDELNYQFYRNLILNSAYLFKSKGTRRSVEFIMRMIGAPKALIEFNETIYLADGAISIDRFNEQFIQVSGGTKTEFVPTLDSTNTFKIQGTTYSGFTTDLQLTNVPYDREDYPIDSDGYPTKPTINNDFFFQQGSGWYEQTPQHRSKEILDRVNSTFTGQNPDIQTTLESYTYGAKYLNRFRSFPAMNLGYNLYRVKDNNKSWTDNEIGLRRNTNGGYNARYITKDERLVLNAKNIELYLNMGQGLLYDVWDMSVNKNYPFPSTGLTIPYPTPNGVDWTSVNPKPKEKTFFEFAQTFYRNLINVRNRQVLKDAAVNSYPTLQSIYWKYLQSEESVNIPSNKYTYQKMIDFTIGLGDYWMRLVEQMIPATTLWMGGQKFENSIFHRQKHAWRRQRGCEIVPIPCIPCEFDGQLFGYDCINQTLTCDVGVDSMAQVLNTAIQTCVAKSGYTINDCVLNSLTSEWYVDVRLNNTFLVQEKFFTGYGSRQYPTQNQWTTAIDEKLEYLYQQGLNYSLNGNTLTIANSSCYDDFTEKTLTVNIGINIDINCS